VSGGVRFEVALTGVTLLASLGIGVALAASTAAKADRVLVSAGPFSRGSTKGEEDERPVTVRKLGAFRIDRTEVTRAQYARCVAARKCKPVSVDVGQDDDLPVTNVDWFQARAYCAFAGGRLPTEDEWEKAARGSDGRVYPWGNDLDCAHANWGNFENEGPCAGKNPGMPVAVGSYPQGASPYGALDLAGNVWEWTADKYDRDPTRRVVRGGSCCSYFVEPRASNRNAWAPNHRDGDLGFRCVSR
jgi:formylglycine-generating enzyme required for sulfatase activity